MAAREDIHGFVGRSRELAELSQALAAPAIQLVTIVGTGGVGKTRLAREAIDLSSANTTWVSHSSVDSAMHVPAAIALALGDQIPDTASPWEALANSWNDVATPLVLDNLEQIPDLADPLTGFLTRVPGTRVLATSRTALHIPGEYVLELAPLPLTTTTHDVSAATRMFVASAQRIRTDFQPTPEDIEVIDQLCHHLDGLPLSIEIVAAQMRVMSPRDILASLAGFPRHVLRLPARGDTLEATIARSYALIPEDAQQLFRRLSLAPAGVTLPIAQALVGEPERAQTLINQLLDHHLLLREPCGRYSMLETIRAFAEQLLMSDAGANDARVSLADVLAVQARIAGDRRDFADGRGLMDAVNLEWNTIRPLMAALIVTHPESAATLLVALEQVVFARGHVAEAWTWMNALLMLPACNENAALTLMAARLARLQALYGQSGLLTDLARELETSAEHQAWVDYEYGSLRRMESRYDDARAFFLRAEAAFTAIGNDSARIKTFNGLGCVEMDVANWDDAARWFETGLALARETGSILDESRITLNRGYLATLQNDLSVAVKLHKENIHRCELVGDVGNMAMNYVNLAGALIGQQQWDEAEQYELLALPLLRSLGSLAGEANTLSGRAAIARGRGDYDTERELLDRLIDLRRSIGHPTASAQLQRVRSWRESGEYERADADLEEISASPELLAFHRVLGRWYRGRSGARQQLKDTLVAIRDKVELHGAVDFLVESTDADLPLDFTPTSIQRLSIPERSVQGIDLTEREREVLRLVAAGRTDRQIGEELFVSSRTVGFHVSNILRKLALTSRAEAAAWAARNLAE